MRTVAIIPARGGSKGVPGKNKRLLAGVPLVARTIRAARAARGVDQVYVSTDDAEIAQIARDWGAHPIDRPAEIAGDAASSESAILHVLDTIAEAGKPADAFVFLQCTSPFTSGEDIDQVLAPVAAGDADCALSVAEDHGFLWTFDESGAGAGINHDPARPRQRRQDLPPQYRETGAIYAIRTAPFRAVGHRFCGRTIPVAIEAPPLEIDTLEDWALAEAVATTRPRPIPPLAEFDAIRTIVTDFDGVHTDDRVLVDQDGREAVWCSRRDGMGIEMLRKAGYRLLILSKEKNPVVARRAEKLQAEVIHGADAKCDVLTDWLSRNGLTWEEIAFVGNDINDIDCMTRARLAFCPADGHLRARMIADVVTNEPGGLGALRSIAEMFLKTPDGA